MRFQKTAVERVTVVKTEVDNRGSDCTGCFRTTARTDNGVHAYENSRTLKVMRSDRRN